jgi:hypothetical protein
MPLGTCVDGRESRCFGSGIPLCEIGLLIWGYRHSLPAFHLLADMTAKK